MKRDSDEREYILGTDEVELARLSFQHQAWVEHQYRLVARAGITAGQTVLDLGCGPGFTSFELAHAVGDGGRVIARDVSARFLRFVADESRRRGLPWIEPSLGAAEDLDLPRGSLDGAYARWLFCWLPDPGRALARVAEMLAPGGAVVLQEYLDWAAKKLLPRHAAHDRVVDACMKSWELGGGIIDVGERIPELAAACGLEVEHFEPVARTGTAGSLVWRWLDGFYRSYLPKLVERQLLTSTEVHAFFAEWDARAASGQGRVCAPTMADIVLRKPR